MYEDAILNPRNGGQRDMGKCVASAVEAKLSVFACDAGVRLYGCAGDNLLVQEGEG
jgi:hypothetical protein